MSAKQVDYRTLSQELESVMSELQREDIDVDEALKLYERGLELVTSLEKYLASAETKVRQLKASPSPEA